MLRGILENNNIKIIHSESITFKYEVALQLKQGWESFLTALFLLLFSQGMLAKIRFSSSFSSTGSSAAEGNRHEVTMEMRVWIKYLAINLLLRPWHTYPSHLGQRSHGATMFGANCGVVLLFPKRYKRCDICRRAIKSKRMSYNDVILPRSESVSEAQWDRQNSHHQTSHWKSEAREAGWEKRVRDVSREKDTGIRTDKIESLIKWQDNWTTERSALSIGCSLWHSTTH